MFALGGRRSRCRRLQSPVPLNRRPCNRVCSDRRLVVLDSGGLHPRELTLGVNRRSWLRRGLPPAVAAWIGHGGVAQIAIQKVPNTRQLELEEQGGFGLSGAPTRELTCTSNVSGPKESNVGVAPTTTADTRNHGQAARGSLRARGKD